MGGASTRPLTELRREDAAEFGGKSAGLGELLAAGIPVPPGFALGARAFRAFVAEAGLEDTIAAALRRASGATPSAGGGVHSASRSSSCLRRATIGGQCFGPSATPPAAQASTRSLSAREIS